MNETPMSAATKNKAANTPRSSQRIDNWHSVGLPLFLLALALAGIGIFAYLSAKQAIKQNVAANMEAIAKLKASQIEHWLDERREDTELIATLQFSVDLQQWLNDGERDDPLKKKLLAQLRFPGTTKYREIGLHSPLDGRLLLTSGQHLD
ncbi:MAG: cache domain-containing protein, partial [Burkholderiales bacterium]